MSRIGIQGLLWPKRLKGLFSVEDSHLLLQVNALFCSVVRPCFIKLCGIQTVFFWYRTLGP